MLGGKGLNVDLDKEVFSFSPSNPESYPKALRRCLVEYLPIFYIAVMCPLGEEKKFDEFCGVHSRKQLGVMYTDGEAGLFVIFDNGSVSRVLLSKSWDTDMNSFHHPIFGDYSVTVDDFDGETCLDKFGTPYPALIFRNHDGGWGGEGRAFPGSSPPRR